MTAPTDPARDHLHELIAATAQREYEDSITNIGTVAHAEHLGSRIAAEVLKVLHGTGAILPAGTWTVEQFNSRLYRGGTLMDEPDTAETREHAQARVDWHTRKREAESGWPGVAVLVRRYQHTTPWATVEETP
ncbi:hypothetical protein MED01_002364 [Micromonospora sp. MED01]|uniref:hypothetical protein n=1 Tax=Micromonospora alfalfae TaxID=2911212 RepID=UPI001EE8053D|nr:hypothetical protein [Micromonospora alfalfae]MCG5464199.1 hypothetical protein [Micromonospora alfalfae]